MSSNIDYCLSFRLTADFTKAQSRSLCSSPALQPLLICVTYLKKDSEFGLHDLFLIKLLLPSNYSISFIIPVNHVFADCFQNFVLI